MLISDCTFRTTKTSEILELRSKFCWSNDHFYRYTNACWHTFFPLLSQMFRHTNVCQFTIYSSIMQDLKSYITSVLACFVTFDYKEKYAPTLKVMKTGFFNFHLSLKKKNYFLFILIRNFIYKWNPQSKCLISLLSFGGV